jgi:PKD repeat protein
MEVRDAGGLTARTTSSVDVSVSSSAPVAHFTVTPESGRISDFFLFNANASYDSEDDINQLKIRWDYDGDGIWDTDWSNSKIEVHWFRVEGKYVSKLEVLDTQGLTGSTTKIINVSVANIKPTAFFTVDPENGTTETQFNFDASGSTDPEDLTANLQVRWDWENDGTFDTEYRTIKTIQHTFLVAGTYTVVMEVVDTEGYGSMFSRVIHVTNPNTPPDADFTITPEKGKVDSLITFDASISKDTEDSLDQLEVRWDWNNDNIYDTPFSTEKVFRRSFSEPGTYSIKVQVRDSGGLTDTRVKQLVIE